MTMWFIGCTHFDHRTIIELTDRPYADVWNMNHDMTERWNRTVQPDDVVFHLGDFSFGNAIQMRETLRCLTGKKILIRGNHDRGAQGMMNVGFQAVLENASVRTPFGELFLSHRPVYDIAESPLHTVAVVHAHIHRGKPEDLERAEEAKTIPKFCVNVSAEAVHYTPVSLKWIHRKIWEQATSIPVMPSASAMDGE